MIMAMSKSFKWDGRSSKAREPGTWKGIRNIDGTLSASIVCPQCTNIAHLEDHSIDSDGTVNPSLVCPFDGCKFHEWGILEGWGEWLESLRS